MNSPIQLHVLEQLLANYPNTEAAWQLHQGFRHGFPLHYKGARQEFNCTNLKSALQNQHIVKQKIQKEVQEGRVAGPFEHRPLPNLRISPLGLVPKKGGDFRLIHHLSYPQGNSVNDFIEPELCSVNYTKFDKAVQMIQQLGKGALLGKADIKSAFRLIPIRPEDFDLLGFKFDEKFYFDKALPFGCSISCATFEMFSTFLEWAARRESMDDNIEHYLDDFLFGGKAGTNHCWLTMSKFFNLCERLGVPIAQDKTVWPVTTILFLGLELDSIKLQVRIPNDKLQEIVLLIKITLTKNKVTLKELQSIIGLLNFMCRAIVPGRPFSRRLINATCGITKPWYHIRITKEIEQDLKVWLNFFDKCNGISVFHDTFWYSNADFTLYTDSSAATGKGFGVYFNGKWTVGVWPDFWHEKGMTANITLLEYFTILVAIYIWGEQFHNKKVNFRCDNASVVTIINSQTSKDKAIMVLVRALTMKCLEYNLVLKAEHTPGSKNEIADSLSRLQMDRFHRLAPTAEKYPVPMPAHLWNIFSLEPHSY